MRNRPIPLLACLAAAWLLQAVPPASGQAFQSPVRASWTEDSATTATLAWDRLQPGRGTVRYGPSTNYSDVAHDGGGTFRHVIPLRGLAPATRYFYEASSSDGFAQTGVFHTAPLAHQPIHFAIHGDLYGSVNESAASDVAARITMENPQFIVNVGDMAFEDYTDTGFDTWQAFFRTCSNMLANAIFMPTMGGHDSAPDNDYARAAYQRIFALPEPSLGNSFYSFGAGNLRFISLNNDLPASAQNDFLARELQAAVNDTNVVWIAALCHEPPYSWGFRLGTDEVRENWAPLLTRYEADWMFNGHSHNYQRSVPIDGVRYLVAGGGGGALYASATNEPLHAFATTCYHHVSFHITNDVLQMQAVRSDGLVFDSTTITNRRHVRVAPAFPLRGQTATILYRPAAGPLAGADPVYLHVGIDAFTNAFLSEPMAWDSARLSWTRDIPVPPSCTQRLAFAFHDGAGLWHNNHGQNWQALLDRASLASAPATAGDSITLRYESDMGPLAGASGISAWISFAGAAAPATNVFAMAPGAGTTWECPVPVPADAESMTVHFTSGNGIDDNHQRLWTFPVAGATAQAWPPEPIVPPGSPVITSNPPGDIPDNPGDNFDLAMVGPPLPVLDAPQGFGDFGSLWLNADETHLYIGGHGMDLGGSNNMVMLFLGLDTLNDNAWNLWHKSGLPNALDFLHNLRFTEPMDVALILGDTFGDNPAYPNFSMGGTGGYDSGMGLFYIGTNSSSFVPMSTAKLSQFHGTGTTPCPTGGSSTNRRTTRWEAALPWSALAASGPRSISNLFVCGAIGSRTVQGNNRYLSRTLLGDRAWGLRDSHGQYAFATVTLRPRRVNLLHADLQGDGIPNQWRQDHFGSPGGPSAHADSDADGHDNFAEYVAGTHPLDPLSLFAVQLDPSFPATLHWPSAADRRYTTYFTTNMLAPFQPLAPDLDTNAFLLPADGFYRVGVRLPE